MFVLLGSLGWNVGTVPALLLVVRLARGGTDTDVSEARDSTMWRPGMLLLKVGVFGLLGGFLSLETAQAQYGGYSSYGLPNQGGWSVQVGLGYPATAINQGYTGYPSAGVNYAGGGYPGGYPVNPGVACQSSPSPAQRQGYREGRLYWETGIAPNRPLSPAEAQGFQAGENRASSGYGYPY